MKSTFEQFEITPYMVFISKYYDFSITTITMYIGCAIVIVIGLFSLIIYNKGTLKQGLGIISLVTLNENASNSDVTPILSLIIYVLIVMSVGNFLWNNLKLYKIIQNLEAFIGYTDPKTSKLKTYSDISLNVKLEVLKEPLNNALVMGDLTFIHKEKEILKTLQDEFLDIYAMIEEKEFIKTGGLVSYILREHQNYTQQATDSDFGMELGKKQKYITQFFQQMEFKDIANKDDLLNKLLAFNAWLHILDCNYIALELRIIYDLLNYSRTELTRGFYCVIEFYILGIKFMDFVSFKKEDNDNVMVTRGPNLNLPAIINKTKTLITSVEADLVINYGSKAHIKANLMYGKSFNSLTSSEKLYTLSPFSNYFNESVVKEKTKFKDIISNYEEKKAELNVKLNTVNDTKEKRKIVTEIKNLRDNVETVKKDLSEVTFSIKLNLKKNI